MSEQPHTSHTPLSTLHSPHSASHQCKLVKISGSLFLCIALSLAGGCVTTPRHATLIDVPFIAQEQTNQCGVVALAMAMDYHHVAYDINALSEEAYIPAIGGSPLTLLAYVADSYGLQAETKVLSVPRIRQVIEGHDVPIVYLAPLVDSQTGHFVVITGISHDNRKLRIHDVRRQDQWIRTSTLLKRSSNTNFPAVVLSKTPTL
jgi:ABC-type bacteriocin/lantibiotic exporter with double-glycine peptidase domain